MAGKSGNKKFLHVTEDMFWDADERRKASQPPRATNTFVTPRVEDSAPGTRQGRKLTDLTPTERAKPWSCSFCGSRDRDHECEEYKKALARFSEHRSPIRAGVPWSWAVEHYGEQGKAPPYPREFYD